MFLVILPWSLSSIPLRKILPDLKEKWLSVDSQKDLMSDKGIKFKLGLLLVNVFFCSIFIDSLKANGTLDEVFNIEKEKFEVEKAPTTSEPKTSRPETEKPKPMMERDLEILGEPNSLPTDRLPTTRDVLLYALKLLREGLSGLPNSEKTNILMKRLEVGLIKNFQDYYETYELDCVMILTKDKSPSTTEGVQGTSSWLNYQTLGLVIVCNRWIRFIPPLNIVINVRIVSREYPG